MRLRSPRGVWIARVICVLLGVCAAQAQAQVRVGGLRAGFAVRKLPRGIVSLWGDGEDRLYASSDTSLFRLTRKGRFTEIALPGWPKGQHTELYGGGSESYLVVAVVNGLDQVARVRDGKLVDESRIPRPAGAGQSWNVLDHDGTFYTVYASGAVQIWPMGPGATWKTVTPSLPDLKLRGATLGFAHSLYLLGAEQTVYEFADGRYTRVDLPFDQLSPGAQRSAFVDLWYSSGTHALYVAAEPNYFLRFDLREHSASEQRYEGFFGHTLVEPLEITGLRGLTVPQAQSGVYYDYLWFYSRNPGAGVLIWKGIDRDQGELGRVLPDSSPSRLYLDLLAGEWLAALASVVEPMNLQTVHDFPYRSRTRQSSPVEYSLMPALRLGLGALFRLGGSPLPVDVDPPGGQVAAFAGDLSLGLSVSGYGGPFSSKWSQLHLLPELGYRFALTAPVSTHLGTIGLGVGFGSSTLYFLYQPKLVAGRALGEPAVGFRHGISANLFGEFILDVTHQYLAFAGTGQHDVAVTVAFDFGRLLYGLSLILLFKTGR